MNRLLAVLAIALSAGLPVAAQVLYGSLTGVVQDAAGAVVPGAAVKVRNTDTSQEFSAQTNDAGGYTFSNLVSGAYELTFNASGFRPVTRRGIAISVNTVRREDVSLEVGQVNESVTVQAGTATLQTDKTDVHAELTSKELINMMLPHYRNYQSVINMVPGATPGVLQNSIQAAPGRALSTNVNGVNRNNNTTRIDGAVSVYIWLPHHSAYVPPAETIEAVNVSTNNFDAEQGMAGGAAVTVGTKSRTNQVHGSGRGVNHKRRIHAQKFFYSWRKTKNKQNIHRANL